MPMTLTPLDLEDCQRRNHVEGYVEDIWITYDSIWEGDKRLPTFVITNKDDSTYKVSQRHKIQYNNIDRWDYAQVGEFPTVNECKYFIFDYVNQMDTQLQLKEHGINNISKY